MENLFFQLLQVAIGNRRELSHIPTVTEWSELFAMSKKQALVGVCFAGIQRLGPSETMHLPELLKLQWLGMAAKIQQRNQRLNEECARVCREFAHDGVQCVVLKGQSNLVYYPEELRDARTAGDIDLWCKVPEGVEVAHEVGGVVEKREYRGIEGVIEYCKQYERCQGRGIPWHRVLYYHCEVTSPSGIGIEPHYRPTYLCSPLRNRRLQRWFKEHEQFGLCDANCGESSRAGELVLSEVEVDPSLEETVENVFPIPTVSFNAIYQLLHIYKHLFESGIGLRQLLDYYFVLRALHIEQGSLADRTESMAQWAEGMGISVMSNAKIMHALNQLGMKKFACAVMYVLQTVFAMPDEYLICQPNEKEGKFLLNEIMMAGNFGKYDTRIARGSKSFIGFKVSGSMTHAIEKTKHNMRLLTHYPEEVLWEPFFRVYHWVWRKLELWRW